MYWSIRLSFMKETWENHDWPSKAGFQMFSSRFVRLICACILFFLNTFSKTVALPKIIQVKLKRMRFQRCKTNPHLIPSQHPCSAGANALRGGRCTVGSFSVNGRMLVHNDSGISIVTCYFKEHERQENIGFSRDRCNVGGQTFRGFCVQELIENMWM